MHASVIMVLCFATLSIIFLMLTLSCMVYDKTNRSKMLKENADAQDWLFSGFHHMVYGLFYKQPKSDTLCGISRREYERYCKILHRKNDFEAAVAMRIEGIFILLVCLVCAWLTASNILLTAVFALTGATGAMLLYGLPYSRLKGQVEDRLFRVKDDLPRYLSLLEKAMDMPIDKAMLLTASKFDSPLSEDIIDSINKVSLGADGWQSTLVDLARTYDIEVFSDLILEIINSYEQGVDIRPIVTRKAYEVEQNRLYAVEAHDSKIKTLIYLPIIALKILPLMAMICLPMLTNFV